MKRNKSFSNKNILYLVATPIGNLKEMTPRALEVISECDIVAAEDTRNSSSLLSNYGIKKQMYSLREHNEKEASIYLVNQIKEGKKVCYMSDAGYPGISDPGYILVKECIANDVSVSTLSGASAFLNALVASGIDTSHFYFYGFLSSKEVEAKKELETLKSFNNTIIFYEAPHRIKKTLSLLLEELGNREVTLARELTKLNEEYIRGSLEELSQIDESTLKGEMVIIIEGNKETKEVSEEQIVSSLKLLLSKGLSKKDAIEITSKLLQINKNKIYDIAQNI